MNETYRIVVGPASIGALWIDHFDEGLQCTTDVVRVVMQLLHGTTPTQLHGRIHVATGSGAAAAPSRQQVATKIHIAPIRL